MEISAKLVKELRDKTGSGMMDCKKALAETKGDLEAAVDYLRQKGILKASKKTGRATKEGQIFAYIHPGSKIGVLIEVNCETDFAARTEAFVELVKNLAMQVAASNPVAVNKEGITAEVIEREKTVYRAMIAESEAKRIAEEKLKGKDSKPKPAAIIEQMLEGKVRKYYEENCLLEQAYVRDPDKKVEDIIKSAIAVIGENISVARFTRYQLGETAAAAAESEE